MDLDQGRIATANELVEARTPSLDEADIEAQALVDKLTRRARRLGRRLRRAENAPVRILKLMD